MEGKIYSPSGKFAERAKQRLRKLAAPHQNTLKDNGGAVSYTHLTLPTILRV